MIWSKGFSASCYMARVDPVTWRDVERIEITGGSVKRTAEGIMQSADIDCVNLPQNVEMWVRVWMDTSQGGAHAHEALFTGLATTPDQNIKGRLKTSTAACYSVLKPADDVILPRGWYAQAGSDGAAVVRDLLRVSPAPITVAGAGPALVSTIIAEDGETRLSMAQKILEAINWRIRITGLGLIQIAPQAAEPAAMFDPDENDVVETELTITMDWYEAPNVLMCIDDDLTAIARDDTETSPLSTINRGREVWAVESDCDLGEDENLAEFTRRRLSELQQVEVAAEYDRRYVPDVMPGDLVMMRYPAQGLDGLFYSDEQSIDLSKAGRTSERITAPARLGVEQDKQIITSLVRVVDDDNNYVVSDGEDYLAGLIEREGTNNGS